METTNARSAQSSRSTSNSSSDQASNSSAGWERFLPPRPLRVLLVEEDIATRQIVCALLSKCGYEVRPSADSVTAWNLLENSPTKFDLILADAFLPDLSGNDLLSKIMSHESHKDIPVIMMSSQDSLDVVFKCLLRGAKDFLVKPLRKNELRNLWQHVWRKNRESSRIENGESARGHKRKATRISMSSSGGNSSDGFSISGGTATQVVNSEAVQSQKEEKASHREVIIDQDTLKCEFGSRTLEEKEDYSSNSDDKEDSERSAKAIDLIGTMTEHPIFNRSQPNCESEKSVLTRSHQSLPALELTLRTCSKQQTQTDHNGQTSVQQSYGSAFSRYISNVTSPQHQSIFRSVANLPSDHSSHRGGIDESCGASTLHFPQAIHFSHAGKQGASALSLIASSSDENMRQPPIHEKSLSSFRTPSMNSTTMNGSNHPSNNKTPVNGSENGECGPGDAQSMDQPSAHQCPSVNTDNVELNQRNIHLNQSATVADGASNIENNASVHEMPSHMMASSGGSNLCEDYRTGKSVNYGGSGNWGGNFGGGSEENSMADCSRPATNTISEDLEQLKANDYRTAFRQAALNKFRQKRKVRCFEKKVRYQTRKKLAEQRPRVKGQFVRQTAYNAVTLLQPDA